MTESADHLTVIVPVLNEAENVDELIDRLLQTCQKESMGVEVLFVDGGSVDGTQARVRARAENSPVRLLSQKNNYRGLSGAVVVGAREATTEVIVVMDADLSHSPEMVPKLAAPLLARSHDMVIGSRYAPQGRIVGWSWVRTVLSYCITLLSRLLIDVRDPMAGFFAVKRERLLECTSNAEGYKIGYEILVNSDEKLRVLELPIEFIDRKRGCSKANLKVGWTFLRRWCALAGGRFSKKAFVAGAIIDISVFLAIFCPGHDLSFSHLSSISIAWVFQYILRLRTDLSVYRNSFSFPKSVIIFLLALFLRAGLLETVVSGWNWRPELAIIIVAIATSIVVEIGHSFFVFADPLGRSSSARRWRVAAIGLFAYVFALRLAYMGLANLNPQEAYYWNYSQHLDLSYLDHPPMAAWIIAAGHEAVLV